MEFVCIVAIIAVVGIVAIVHQARFRGSITEEKVDFIVEASRED